MCNVHGHIHGNPTPIGRYINVSVEAINYTPIALEEITAQAAKLLKEFTE
jgi:calcineurin-like phosphoesterase family protein